jgi:hypothetical protein
VITSTSTLIDVAFAVCTALENEGFVVVLTGGSAATFYAPKAYQSKDIDFVITLRGKAGERALIALGYRRKGDYYVHEASPFPVEFPPGPLAIGDDLVTTWNTVRREGELLHILSRTDSCRDRLASFLFWNDFRGLEQALAVFSSRPEDVDLETIQDWCRRERQSDKYAVFKARTEMRTPKSRSSKRK